MTGYNGVFGYRTDTDYILQENLMEDQRAWLDAHPDYNYDQDVADATAVADALKEEGWEFASHTWGHINPRQNSIEMVQRDSQRWHDWVMPVVGESDVLIFAFGADINDCYMSLTDAAMMLDSGVSSYHDGNEWLAAALRKLEKHGA